MVMIGWHTIFELDFSKSWMGEDNRLIFYDWMIEQFGPRDNTLSSGPNRWAVLGDRPIRVCLRYGDDAMLFKLAWL